MTLHSNFIKMVEACKTGKQVYDILDVNGIKVVRDDSAEVGCFSVWLDKTTRIYKPCNRNTMKVQHWHQEKMTYSGIPTFFG